MRSANTIRKEVRQIVQQGNQHHIKELFREILAAGAVEFTEDNTVTLVSHMEDFFREAVADHVAGKPLAPNPKLRFFSRWA